MLWLHDDRPRALDAVSLLALSDAFFGRIFPGDRPHPAVRHGVDDDALPRRRGRELAAHGSAPLAAVADSHVFHRSYCDQSVELYGRGGQLLATSTQMAYFKA